MIKVDKLAVDFGDHRVLDNISFVLPDQQSLIILGRSGSGKTVLIKTIIGLIKPVEGNVFIDNVDMHLESSRQIRSISDRVAIVFQNAALLDSFTIFQNVALPLYERGGYTESQVRDLVYKSLDVVGLSGVMDLYPSDLSGGMRKRVGIARALVYEPKYIIFDEPVSGLDPITAKEVLSYMSGIINSREITAITITHDLRDLHRVGDMALFIEQGRAVFYGSLKDFYHSELPLIKEFIS